MRVRVRATARRLDIRLRPIALPVYWGAGLLFVAAGLVVASLMGRALLFECDRMDGHAAQCRHVSRSLLASVRSDSLPIGDLLGARVDTTTGLVASMRLVARTSAGDIPLPLVGADGDQKESLATVIISFAADSQRGYFAIREDFRWLGGLLGLFLVGAGLLCVLAIERVRLVMNRGRGTVIVRRMHWFGVRRDEAALEQVKGVDLESFSIRQAQSWSVSLLLEGEKQLPLTALPLFTERSANQVADAIRKWLITA